MKQFIWPVLFLFTSHFLFADSGNCIRYKARFDLQNGKTIEGYFNYSTYDSLTFNFTDESFKKFMEKLFTQNHDTINLYLRIQVLKYPEVPKWNDEHYQYQAVVDKDNFKLIKNEVRAYHFIDYSMVYELNLPRENWKFNCGGQSIVTELTQKEIDWLKQKPVAQATWDSQLYLIGYCLASYNSDIEEKGLQALCDRLQLLDEKTRNCNERNSDICYQREYAQIKKEFTALNIILFRLAGPN